MTTKVPDYDFHTGVIELARDINDAIPYNVYELVSPVLNRQGMVLSRANVRIVAIAHEKGMTDVRESPALKFIERLDRSWDTMGYQCPHVPILRGRGGARESVVGG